MKVVPMQPNQYGHSPDAYLELKLTKNIDKESYFDFLSGRKDVETHKLRGSAVLHLQVENLTEPHNAAVTFLSTAELRDQEKLEQYSNYFLKIGASCNGYLFELGEIANDASEQARNSGEVLQKEDTQKLPVGKSAIWEVISQAPTTVHGFRGSKAEEGALVKFGRNLFKVAEIGSRVIKNSATHLSYDHRPMDDMDQVGIFTGRDSMDSSLNKTSSKKNSCRVCLESQNTEDDPLVHLCNCTGSVKFIHYQCLLQWIESQRDVTHHKFYSLYKWKTLSCEICKSKFDDEKLIALTGKSMFEYDFPETDPYLALEGIKEKEIERTYAKIIFLIKFVDNKHKLLLGRASDADVKIKDIQISRFHTYFHLVYNKKGVPEIWLEDLASRFGTLISKTNIPNINASSPVACFQVGCIMISAKYKRNKNSCLCFIAKEKNIMAGFNFVSHKSYFSAEMGKQIMASMERKTSKSMATNFPLRISRDNDQDKMNWDNPLEAINEDRDWENNDLEERKVSRRPSEEEDPNLMMKDPHNLPTSVHFPKKAALNPKPDLSSDLLKEESKEVIDNEAKQLYEDFQKYEVEKQDSPDQSERESSVDKFIENHEINSLFPSNT
ncbi:unnamed protein product [Moneuplotes crassus]|uniref:Uncharacterized protein n=1 Tax=Euplotes crassus TaxID=5936 RepID=A0AAD1Y9U0_EUPCR|nr:unnamed protein product [Moneuplotes crassus]